MATPKHDIEILLEEIVVNQSVKLPSSSRHLGICRLIWPRPTIAEKNMTVPLQLEKGAWKGEGRLWGERILFKEPVGGTFAFECMLTENVTAAAFEKWLRAGASSFLKLAGAAAEDAAALPTMGAVSEIPFALLSRAILGDKSPAVLYGGMVDIAPEDLPASGQAKRFEIELLARKTVRRAGRSVGKGSMARPSRIVLKEGESVGHCSILLKTL